jgi:hypothetical protein
MGGPFSTFCRLGDAAAKQAGGAKNFPALHPTMRLAFALCNSAVHLRIQD